MQITGSEYPGSKSAHCPLVNGPSFWAFQNSPACSSVTERQPTTTLLWIVQIRRRVGSLRYNPYMSDNAPTVLAIGSCRIFRPLRPLHEQGLINLINYGENQWFTHTAAAARQFVDVLDGKAHIPAGLRRAALETDLEIPEDMISRHALQADAVIVEVSSLKQHQVNGIELNAHKVYGIAVESGLDYRPIIQGNTTGLPADHVLKSLQVNYTTQAELTADLLAIRDRVGAAIMTVNHLYSETKDGAPVPERSRLTEALSLVEEEHGIRMYDTKPAIVEHGIDTALLDQNHYRTEFEPVVGRRLLTAIRGLVANRATGSISVIG